MTTKPTPVFISWAHKSYVVFIAFILKGYNKLYITCTHIVVLEMYIMAQLKHPGLINLNNWLVRCMNTVEHIEQQNEVGYFFEKDVADVINCLTQAGLSCKRMDDLLNE